MSDWAARKLGDLIAIKHGFAFKGEYFSEDPAGPILLTPGNFAIGGGFKEGKVRSYSGPEVDGFTLAVDDLVVTMTDLSKTGDTLGYPALIPPGKTYLHNQRIGLVEIKSSEILPRYLYYTLMTPEYRQHVLATATGSTVRHTSPGRIRDYIFTLPPVSVQQSIARLLQALDKKIATNNSIVEHSQALAHSIFEIMVSGIAVGPETFGSVAAVGGGGTPSTSVSEYWDGTIPWATPSDITKLRAPYIFDTSRKITSDGLTNCASALYPPGSILMTSRATIGAFALPQTAIAVNQGFIVVVPPEPDLGIWLFHEMMDRVDEMRSLANGSTFLELSRKNFKGLKVRLPNRSAVEKFARKVIPLHQRSIAASAENITLVELRDSLLPGLMSGRFRVKDAEQAIEETV